MHFLKTQPLWAGTLLAAGGGLTYGAINHLRAAPGTSRFSRIKKDLLRFDTELKKAKLKSKRNMTQLKKEQAAYAYYARPEVRAREKAEVERQRQREEAQKAYEQQRGQKNKFFVHNNPLFDGKYK